MRCLGPQAPMMTHSNAGGASERLDKTADVAKEIQSQLSGLLSGLLSSFPNCYGSQSVLQGWRGKNMRKKT